MGDIKIKNWKEYESKLKRLIPFLNVRIEIYEHNLDLSTPLTTELSTILFYIEEILNLEGVYKDYIRDDLHKYLEKTPVRDNKLILEMLIGYKQRINNNIFTNFFSDEPNKGLYRIELNNGDIYLGFGKNALEVLNNVREEHGFFELDDPLKDVININNCEHFNIDKKNNQNYRCKLMNGPCALANHAQSEECPGLEDLITEKKDFFEDILNGNYSTIERARNL
ncbi:MAG: hypothetical protein AABX61_03955 [Nanoarchaeota archaeon]